MLCSMSDNLTAHHMEVQSPGHLLQYSIIDNIAAPIRTKEEVHFICNYIPSVIHSSVIAMNH